jgi:hypothetical protein
VAITAPGQPMRIFQVAFHDNSILFISINNNEKKKEKIIHNHCSLLGGNLVVV